MTYLKDFLGVLCVFAREIMVFLDEYDLVLNLHYIPGRAGEEGLDIGSNLVDQGLACIDSGPGNMRGYDQVFQGRVQ